MHNLSDQNTRTYIPNIRTHNSNTHTDKRVRCTHNHLCVHLFHLQHSVNQTTILITQYSIELIYTHNKPKSNA